jgi:leucyl aminopeptidase
MEESMKFFLLILFIGLGVELKGAERFIAVPLKNLENLTLAHRPIILAKQNGLALVKLDTPQLDELASNLHKNTLSCGGFSDVQILMERYGVDPIQGLVMAATPMPSLVRAFDKTQPTFPNETKRALAASSPQRMWDFLAKLSAFPNRSADSNEGVQAAQWLGDLGNKLAQAHQRQDVQILTFPTGGSYKQPSVAIRIAGKDSKLPAVLLGGHMDTFNNQKPGADDDGSGTATVMEVYNAILDSGLKFNRDIYFAFYAAEERGLVGSQAMVAEFKKRGIPMRAIMQFDMTGFKSPKDKQALYMVTDNVSPALTKFVVTLAQEYLGIPANMIGGTRCDYACSDHASWTRAGYESVFPFEASFENYNKTLHTSDDKMNIMTLDHAAKFMRLGVAFAVETADPISNH